MCVTGFKRCHDCRDDLEFTHVAVKMESWMKKLALAAALSLAATSAFAGGVEPVTPPTEVEAAASSSNGGLIVPLLLLVLVAAAAGN